MDSVLTSFGFYPGIQQLQLILLKIALLLGVEFHVNVEFINLLEPPEDQENDGESSGKMFWFCTIRIPNMDAKLNFVCVL